MDEAAPAASAPRQRGPNEGHLRHRGARGGARTLLVALAAAPAAVAASGDASVPAPVLPEPLTREAIRELVARLGDAEVGSFSWLSSTGPWPFRCPRPVAAWLR